MKEDLRYFPGWGEPFILELAGMSWCDGSYRIRRTCSPVWVLEQVLEGTGTVEVNGVRHTASAGDVYLLLLGAAHYYYSDPRDPWVKIFMNVRGALPGALISTYGLTGRVVFPAGGLPHPLFQTARRACRTPRGEASAKQGRRDVPAPGLFLKQRSSFARFHFPPIL